MKGKEPFSFPVDDSHFVKSSYTNPGGIINRCVSVAIRPEGVAVRNSNDETKKTVFFTVQEWDAFIKGAKDGEFDV